ncbi:tetratricopeptide repeat protein [Nocardiopsis sp. NPDC049922]|uniref:ATP-binding protein n=1 Tax=Nocardiopsis sp. NPDC049922 TaxID=3155157 RepID=UPI0033DF2848
MDTHPQHPDPARATHNHADVAAPANLVQSGAIHGGVHFHAPRTDTGVPRQLPPPPTEFTDRQRELRELASAPHHDTDLAVLVGTGGVGKTALAAHFLAHHADQYPDGQLYADLAGFTGGADPADPAAVLDGFLRALGVPARQIPQGLEPRAAEFRTRTHGKRLALLLDNAVSPAQVRTLLPGEGAHRVIVTTRLHLLGLVPHGARFVHVRPLDHQAAVELLNALLSGHRDDLPGATSRRLADLCGRLPLALRAVAGRLRLRPGRPAQRVVDELSDEHRRLSALSRDRDSSVTAVFDASYTALPDDVARLYRLLGLHPGPSIALDAAIALDGGDPYDTEDRIEALLDANLLQEDADGRHRFHDLIRDHARARAHTDEPEPERAAALDRLVDRHLRTAVAADLRLNPRRWHLGPLFAEAANAPSPFPDHDTALAWLEAELPVLRSLVRLCHDTGRHQAAWQLCEALWALFTLRQHFEAWTETHTLALASAEAIGDPAPIARTLLALANAHLKLHRTDQALDEYSRALELWEAIDHRLGQGTSLENLGTLALIAGEHERAVAHYDRARRIFAEEGVERGVALMDRHLGDAHRELGAHDTALDHFARAHRYFTGIADDYMTLRTLIGQGMTHLREEREPRARASLVEALAIARRCGARLEEARAHTLLADLARLRRRAPDERDHLTRALAIYTELGAPQAAETQLRLSQAGDPTP